MDQEMDQEEELLLLYQKCAAMHSEYKHAIDYCVQNKLGMPALALIYSYIDSLAWLTVPDKVTGEDFIKWVQDYILLPGGCDANDLYGARCGILHNRAPDSNKSRYGPAKLLEYHLDGVVTGKLLIKGKLPINNSVSSDQSHITDPSKQTIRICLDMLRTVVEDAAVKFLDESFFKILIESHELDASTIIKLEKIRRQYCYEIDPDPSA